MDFEQLQSKILETRWANLLDQDDFDSYMKLTKERITNSMEKVEQHHNPEYKQEELNAIYANSVVNTYCLLKVIEKLNKRIEELEKNENN
tara:strand:- start:175 stop:444 length:270 start_codon:yes stop_codon:yes gene_type:complete